MRFEQYPLFDDLAVIFDSHWSAFDTITRANLEEFEFCIEK